MNKLWLNCTFALSVALSVLCGGLRANLATAAAPCAIDSISHLENNKMYSIFQSELKNLRVLFPKTDEIPLDNAQVQANAPMLCAFIQRELDAVLNHAAPLIKFKVIPFVWTDPSKQLFFGAEQASYSHACHIFVGAGLLPLFAAAPQRLRFLIAHEIGHHACGHTSGPPTHRREHEADLFALKGCGIDQKDARASIVQMTLADNLKVFLQGAYKFDFQQAADIAVAAVAAAAQYDQLCGKFERAPNFNFIGCVISNLLESIPQEKRMSAAVLLPVLKKRLIMAFKNPRQFNEPAPVEFIKPFPSDHPVPAARSAVLESGQLPA